MEMAPVLKRTTQVQRLADDGVAISYLEHAYELRGAAAEAFDAVFALPTEGLTLQEIARDSGQSERRIRSMLSVLGSHDLLARQPDANGTMTGLQFYEYHRKFCRHWLKEIYEHPFWDKVMQGTATAAQILGFAFEKYHYIEGAHEHMGLAAANASREMMPHLARHFCEEYTHGDIYRKGLAHLFDDEVILNSQPLPSTRALLNFLNEAAAQDSFAYYAANEFLQMTENEDDDDAEWNSTEAISGFYAGMTKNYPYTQPLVDAFIKHTQLDQHLEHEGAFLAMCKDIPPLTMGEVQNIMETTRSLVDVLKLFMDGIDVFYQHFPDMPRMPSTLLSE